MDNYEIVMKGPFICEKVDTLPSWTSLDEGRFIYTLDTHKTYYGTNSAWTEFSSGGTGVGGDGDFLVMQVFS